MSDVDAVLDWWFGPTPPQTREDMAQRAVRWFREGAKLDPVVREKFGALVTHAVNGGELEGHDSPKGRVATIIVLDQLTRHVFRDQARMYAGDARAQALAKQLFDSGLGRTLRIDWRHFSMMPMLHSEDLALQRRSVEEMDALVADAPEPLREFFAMGIEQSRKYLDVISRFGRFPHRNALLGRASTDDEKKFMETFVGPPRDFDKKVGTQGP